MAFINTYMILGSGENTIETQQYFAISFTNTLDETAPSLSFSLPDIEIFDNLKYEDPVIFYALQTETKLVNVRDIVSSENIVFNGILKTNNPVEGKGNIQLNIDCIGTLGLINDRQSLIANVAGSNVFEILVNSLELAELTSRDFPDSGQIPFNTIKVTNGLLEQSIGIALTGSKSIKEVVDEMKAKYSYKIFQQNSGDILISSPWFLSQNVETLISWAFDNTIYTNFDYGDTTKNIEGVIVIGAFGVIGAALDAAAVVAKSKTDPTYRIVKRLDLRDTESCDRVARDILLDILKDNQIALTAPINFNIRLGHTLTVTNKRFDGNEVFFIQSISWNLDKGQASMDITAYAHTLTDVPESVITDTASIADIDIIIPVDKTKDEFLWDNFGGTA